MTTIKVIMVLVLNFLYITIFKVRAIKKMSERDRVLEARKIMKEFSKKIIKAAKIDLEVKFLNKEKYKKIRLEDGVIIVANHDSNMDIPIILAALDIPIGFIAKKEMENWMFFSTWMQLSNSIFLDRENPREGIKGIKKSIKIAREGYPLAIFPEGRRSDDGNIAPFKKGSFKLIAEVNGIVIPVTIDGSFYIQNRKSIKINKNKKVILTVGEPINLSLLTPEEKKKLDVRVREIISEQKIRR